MERNPHPAKFEIRRMYKSNVAWFYGVSWPTMARQIARHTELQKELRQLGIYSRAKHLTAAEVALIVKYLGAPSYTN